MLPDQQGRIFVITNFSSEKIKRIGPVIFNGIEHKWYQGQIHVSNKCTVKNILQFNSRLIFYIPSLVFMGFFFTSLRVSKSNAFDKGFNEFCLLPTVTQGRAVQEFAIISNERQTETAILSMRRTEKFSSS